LRSWRSAENKLVLRSWRLRCGALITMSVYQ